MPMTARMTSSGAMSSRMRPAPIARPIRSPMARVSRAEESRVELARRARGRVSAPPACPSWWRPRRYSHAASGAALRVGGASAARVFGEFYKLIDLTAIDGLKDVLARREMAVERADADAGLARHGFEAGIRAARVEHVTRRDKQPVAIAQRIRARLAACLLRFAVPIFLSFTNSLAKRRHPPYNTFG